MTHITIDQLKKFESFPETKRLREKCLGLRELAKLERIKIDMLVKPEFAKFEFWTEPDHEDGGDGDSRRIEHEIDLFLTNDEDGVAKWYKRRDEIIKEAGYDLPSGYCPTLVAEENLRQAENAMLDHASEFFGFNFRGLYGPNGELRKKALDLFLNPPVTAEKS